MAEPANPLTLATDELCDLIETTADRTESERRVPAVLSDALAHAGMYRLMVPSAYGGLEVDPATSTGIFEQLAYHDASAAWVSFIGATTGTTLAALPPETAREIFAAPTTLMTGVFAPRGRAERDGDAFRVNGRWQWGSGCQNADWIAGGCMLYAEGELERSGAGAPRQHMFIAPAADVEIHDTWQASGLCGTGSTDFSFVDLELPAEHAVGLAARPLETPLYRFPQFCLLALGIAAVSLGITRRAIDELIDLAGGKKPTGSSRVLAERATTQIDTARAEALYRSARLFLYDNIGTCWDRASAGDPLPVELRRDLRLATTHTVRSCAQAVDLMYELGGGTSVYRSSRLQRCFRDIHVATQHIMVAPTTLETTGRLFLGVETSTATL